MTKVESSHALGAAESMAKSGYLANLFEPFDKTRIGSASWLSIIRELLVSVLLTGFVAWPSSAADTGKKARIV